jgi:hypothetical protein
VLLVLPLVVVAGVVVIWSRRKNEIDWVSLMVVMYREETLILQMRELNGEQDVQHRLPRLRFLFERCQ